MLQRREDLALVTEALGEGRGRQLGADQLDGYVFFVLVVGAGGEKYDAHAARPELALEPVGPDAAARKPDIFRLAAFFARRFVGSEQGENFLPKLGVVSASPLHEGGAFPHTLLQGSLIEGFDS